MSKIEKKPGKGEGIAKDIKYIGGMLLAKMARSGAALLRLNADAVNKLNVFPVPDGDTGDNMRMTIESGIATLENMDSDDLSSVMKTFSHGMLLGARGNSGVILSQFFAGVAKGLEGSEEADPQTLGRALEQGVQTAYASVMSPTEGTILTVAREAVEYAVGNITPQSTIRTLFADLVKEMDRSLERTPEALTVLKEAGVVDSGGAGLLYIIDGFNRVLNGEEVTADGALTATSAKPAAAHAMFNADSEMTFGYCTELLLQLLNKKTDVEHFDIGRLKKFLSSIGDSVVAFKTDSIVKVHVHTFTPEKAIGFCRQFGEFINVKIENMSFQHTSLDGGASAEKAKVEEAPKAQALPAPEDLTPEKKYGVVAVANGPGIEALFTELGADRIVQGGQTQNPSTNDFLHAFAQIRAEHIFVFPNNGNIFMAAQQAAEIYKNATVHVMPSKNIGTGYVALSSLDVEDPSPESVIDTMTAAMQRVSAGYISPAVRDADMNGVHVNKGDTIAIMGKQIIYADPEKMGAAKGLADKLFSDPEKFMLTVFCGKDSTDADRDELTAYLSEKYPSHEVYFIDGGQDIYPFILIAE